MSVKPEHINATSPSNIALPTHTVAVANTALTVPADSGTTKISPPCPPQSAAYPAMPTQLAQPSSAGTTPQAATQAMTNSVTAQEQTLPSTGAEQGTNAEGKACIPETTDQDVVISGRKGSPAGTITVPADQTPVAWPKVPGAPPGYPGLFHCCTNVHSLVCQLLETLAVGISQHATERFDQIYRSLLPPPFSGAYAPCCRHTKDPGWPCTTAAVPWLHGQAHCQSG